MWKDTNHKNASCKVRHPPLISLARKYQSLEILVCLTQNHLNRNPHEIYQNCSANFYFLYLCHSTAACSSLSKKPRWGLRAEQWYLDSRWTSVIRKGKWAVGLQAAGVNYGDAPQLHLTYSRICALCKTCWREGGPSFLRAVSRHTRKLDVWGVQVLREDAQN